MQHFKKKKAVIFEKSEEIATKVTEEKLRRNFLDDEGKVHFDLLSLERDLLKLMEIFFSSV